MKGETEKLPTHVTYKIRMDADKVDSTRRIRDKSVELLFLLATLLLK